MRIKDNALRVSGFDDPGIVSDLTYLTHLETISRKGSEPQWPAVWKPDWSLDDMKEVAKRLGDTQFPTLNLRIVLDTLEKSALSSASQEEPQVLKFNMAYRKKDS
jgi:hypothetical protein